MYKGCIHFTAEAGGNLRTGQPDSLIIYNLLGFLRYLKHCQAAIKIVVKDVLKTCKISIPVTAMDSNMAIRDTALLIPEAIPACRASTALITVAVKGAILIAIPSPRTIIPGKKVSQ
jgi:hypothetical protein